MIEQSVTYVVDKSTWPRGPWDRDPDYALWRTRVGYYGIVRRVPHNGIYCGYVAIPPDHPYYNVGYDDVPVEVHGGLTYAAVCDPQLGVCHTPQPDEPEEVWWLGFDAGHWNDIMPGMLKELGFAAQGEYRDFAYMQNEVESLAQQLKALA